MPTLDDLRTVLADGERFAGDAETVMRRVEQRQASIDTDTSPRGKPRQRRRIAYGLASVAVAVCAVAVPALLPSGAPGGATPAAAAELSRLAEIFAASPFDDVTPGHFLHRVLDIKQGPAALDHLVLESWTAYDGTLWRRDVNNGPPLSYFEVPATAAKLSPAALAQLRSDPRALDKYLPQGGAAIFERVQDLMIDGTAPLALRAGLFERLKATPGVDIGPATTDVLGRPVVEFDYNHNGHNDGSAGIESLYFDPSTAELVQYTDRPAAGAPDAYSYTAIVSAEQVVDSVPADVQQKACVTETPDANGAVRRTSVPCR